MSFHQIMRLMSLHGLYRANVEGNAPAAAEETITSLETGTADGMGVTGDTCPIQMTEFEKDDDVTKLPCGHVFAKQPIETWLREKKAQCPSCRAPLPSASQETEHAAIAVGRGLERQLLLHTMGALIASQMEGGENSTDLQWAISSSIQYSSPPVSYTTSSPPLSPD